MITPRLRLVPATVEPIDSELAGPDQLGPPLGASVPSDWPPEYHDDEVLAFWREQLSKPGSAGWWLHYAVLTDSGEPTLVGSMGYKGPPADGVVEIGYSVVRSRQPRGLFRLHRGIS